MNKINIRINDVGRGKIVIEEEGNDIAEMVIGETPTDLTVYHTEVSGHHQGKGLARQLFDEMLTYARGRKLKVISLCAYVTAQFKRHPEQYRDIWNTDWHNK